MSHCVPGVEDLDTGPNTNESLANITNRFAFVDGSREGLSFFQESTGFPWKKHQPDDASNTDDCVR